MHKNSLIVWDWKLPYSGESSALTSRPQLLANFTTKYENNFLPNTILHYMFFRPYQHQRKNFRFWHLLFKRQYCWGIHSRKQILVNLFSVFTSCTLFKLLTSFTSYVVYIVCITYIVFSVYINYSSDIVDLSCRSHKIIFCFNYT